MSARADVLVIGGGPNGLTAAALLGRAGRRVVLVERCERLGGLAAPEPFHPGYSGAGLFHDTSMVRSWVTRRLDLEKHGLRVAPGPPAVLGLGEDGRSLWLDGDPDRAAREIARHCPRDGEAYGRWLALLDGLRPVLAGFLDELPTDWIHPETTGPWQWARRGLRLRRLGRDAMMELLRLPPMCVADWLGEWFETGLLRATLALPAVAGTTMGPRSPGSNANLLLCRAAMGRAVAGGGPVLVRALEASARNSGVEIRSGAAVEQILTDADGVRGVTLAGGEQVLCSLVAASCDPQQTLLRLLPAGSISRRLDQRIRAYRARGTTARVLLALDRPPRFAGREQDTVEFARTAAELDDIERAHDAIKYRRVSEKPVLDLHVPTASNADLAPSGHAVLSALVHFAPYDVDGGWDERARERLGETVVDLLERHAPGIGATIVHRLVQTPPDLEARYGLTGGHVHHGEHALDQILIRPVPECSGYRTPVPGLWLCGSGSHPGGGLTCAPGALAATAILGRR